MNPYDAIERTRNVGYEAADRSMQFGRFVAEHALRVTYKTEELAMKLAFGAIGAVIEHPYIATAAAATGVVAVLVNQSLKKSRDGFGFATLYIKVSTIAVSPAGKVISR